MPAVGDQQHRPAGGQLRRPGPGVPAVLGGVVVPDHPAGRRGRRGRRRAGAAGGCPRRRPRPRSRSASRSRGLASAGSPSGAPASTSVPGCTACATARTAAAAAERTGLAQRRTYHRAHGRDARGSRRRTPPGAGRAGRRAAAGPARPRRHRPMPADRALSWVATGLVTLVAGAASGCGASASRRQAVRRDLLRHRGRGDAAPGATRTTPATCSSSTRRSGSG